MTTLTEDDLYRTSTQYRLWGFHKASLASLRESTNKAAAARVVEATRRAQHTSNNGETQRDVSIDTLTPSEELAITIHYTRMTIATAASLNWPTVVAFTAGTYLRRFYLANSPMTYHPKDLLPTCLFLATKTENHYHSLNGFIRKMQDPPIRSKITADEVRATEFVLCQGLRFAFDVRQPTRGLSGGLMELLALAQAKDIGTAATDAKGNKKTAQNLQKGMMELAPPPMWIDKKGHERRLGKATTPRHLEDRAGAAHEHAKEILADVALLTDVCFLYTPSQVWFGALLVADEALANFYLSVKLPQDDPLTSKIQTTIRSCATMLATHDQTESPSSIPRDELVRIDRKLYHCRNPEKRDLVGLHKAQKRNGAPADGGDVDERAAKKRKAEREQRERDEDVFGAPLAKKD